MATERERIFQDMERKLADLDRREAVQAQLPEELREAIGAPRIISQFGGKETWLCWTVPGERFHAALAGLLLAFPALDCEARESGCLSVAPAARNSYPNGKLRWSLPVCYEIVCESIRNVGGSAEVIWYGTLADGSAARIQLGVDFASRHFLHRLFPHVSAQYDRQQGNPYNVKKYPPSVQGHKHMVSWGTGSGDSARYSFYFENPTDLTAALTWK